jgi:outer membrane protein assembly factor BamB
MDREDEYFTPEAVDEQIDRLLHDPQRMPPLPERRMLQELQRLHDDEEHRLKNIWKRFAEQPQSQKNTTGQLIDIQYYQQKRLRKQQAIAQNLTVASRKRTTTKRIGLLLTEIVAVLVIISVLVIPAIIRNTATLPSTIHNDFYINNNQGVMSIDATTKRVNWTYPIADYTLGTPSNPLVNNGIVYAESQDSIYALDTITGLPLWSHTFDSQFSPYPVNKAGPVLSGNAMYVSVVSAARTEVYKMDATTGNILQIYSPVLDTNIVGIAVANNILYAFGLYDMCAMNLANGKQIWYQQMGQSQSLGIPHVAGNMIYTISSSDAYWPNVNLGSTSYINAFDTKTGYLIWQSGAIHGSATDIAIANGLVYAGAADGSIQAYDMQTGIQVWKQVISGMSFTGIASPQVNAGTLYMNASIVYMNTENSTMSDQPVGIIALDTTTGKVKWQYPKSLTEMKRAEHMFGAPVVQNGIVYVNDALSDQTTSELYALNNGTVLWHQSIQSGT